MPLILWCCNRTIWAPSSVCPFWSVCIWVLSVVTPRNWLCSGSHQIVELLWQCSSDSTDCGPGVSCEIKKKNNNQKSSDLAAEESRREVLFLVRAYYLQIGATVQLGPKQEWIDAGKNTAKLTKLSAVAEAKTFIPNWGWGGFISVIFEQNHS